MIETISKKLWKFIKFLSLISLLLLLPSVNADAGEGIVTFAFLWVFFFGPLYAASFIFFVRRLEQT